MTPHSRLCFFHNFDSFANRLDLLSIYKWKITYSKIMPYVLPNSNPNFLGGQLVIIVIWLFSWNNL